MQVQLHLKIWKTMHCSVERRNTVCECNTVAEGKMEDKMGSLGKGTAHSEGFGENEHQGELMGLGQDKQTKDKERRPRE